MDADDTSLAHAPADASPSASHALDAADRERLTRYFSARHAAATRRAYASDWASFAAWCDARAMPPLPATPETVAAYLAAEADAGRAVSTVRRRAAAIRLAHRLCSHEPPTNSELVRGAVRGIARTHGSAPQQKVPAVAERVRAMIDTLDTRSLGGLRDRAIVALGFAGAFRRSELAALVVEDLQETTAGLRVRIRQSKTDAEGLGQIVPVVRGGAYCPVRAVAEWRSRAGISAGPLFRRLYRGERVAPTALSAHSIAAVVKRCAAAAGFDPTDYAGHSLRAGFLTSAASNGASLARMMIVSRHRDPKTVMRYVRLADEFQDHAGDGLL